MFSIIITPLSWLYSVVVWVRNVLYDERILPSQEVDIPTIGVGNLAVGGTGKTPMTEYLLRLLSGKYQVAVLSRGYGRKTTGFRLARPTDTARTIGDEPLQIHLHFPDVPVAVCANRVEGIKRLRQLFPKLQCVILDDAFQHRHVAPGVNIVLMDYNRPIYEDSLMPTGMLREPKSSLLRAHVIIVTKCPEDIKPIEGESFLQFKEVLSIGLSYRIP